MGCSPRPSSSPRPFSASVLASPAAPRDVSPTPGDLLGASFSVICSVLSSKAVVRLELLRDVVGHCRYRVNNHLDHKYKPRPVNVIIYSAKKKIGEEMEYRLLGKNCEHFVTDLTYGVPHSRQVRPSLGPALSPWRSAAGLGVTRLCGQRGASPRPTGWESGRPSSNLGSASDPLRVFGHVAVSLVLSFPMCRRSWMEDLWRPASLTF